MEILKNIAFHFPNMRIGRFTVRAGEKIPLHIHREQFGFSYMLDGICNVTSYQIEYVDGKTITLNNRKKVKLITNQYCVLTPLNNAHELEIIEDSTFLDIFAPGKNEGALSEFLRVTKSEDNGKRIYTEIIPRSEVNLPTSLVDNLSDYMAIEDE